MEGNTPEGKRHADEENSEFTFLPKKLCIPPPTIEDQHLRQEDIKDIHVVQHMLQTLREQTSQPTQQQEQTQEENKDLSDDDSIPNRPQPKQLSEDQEAEAEKEGSKLLGFGTYGNETYRFVAITDPSYCRWCLSQKNPSPPLALFQNYLREFGCASLPPLHEYYDYWCFGDYLYFDDRTGGAEANMYDNNDVSSDDYQSPDEGDSVGTKSKVETTTKETRLPEFDDYICAVCKQEIPKSSQNDIAPCRRTSKCVRIVNRAPGLHECIPCSKKFTCKDCGAYDCRVCREDERGRIVGSSDVLILDQCAHCKDTTCYRCQSSCALCSKVCCKSCSKTQEWYYCEACAITVNEKGTLMCGECAMKRGGVGQVNVSCVNSGKFHVWGIVN